MRDLKIYQNSNDICELYETYEGQMLLESLGNQVNGIPKEIGSLKAHRHSHLKKQRVGNLTTQLTQELAPLTLNNTASTKTWLQQT